MIQSTSPISPQDGTIGFVGLGWMGSNFAARLLAAGWRLRVYDIVPDKRGALAEKGAIAAETVEEIVGRCDVVLMSLRSSDVAVEVLEKQMLPRARAGQVLVDLGTTRLTDTRRLASALARQGAALLDSPVSGDPRTPLYLFVGGDAQALERVRPVLAALAHPDHLTHGGASGAGQILKAVNQLCMGLVPAAYMEAISFATRQGIDAATVSRAVGGDSGWRSEMAGYCRRIAEGQMEGNDIKFAEFPYFLDAAAAAGIDMPLLKAAFSFCDPGPRNWRDNMDRPYTSFWYMLHHPDGGMPPAARPSPGS